MSNKSKVEKQVHKTQEQLLAEAKVTDETLRLRGRVKGDLFPLLIRTTKSVEDAKMFCQIIATSIKQAFNNKMRDTKVEELKLIEMLAETDEKARYQEMLNMFGSETLTSALRMIDEMPGMIDRLVAVEMSKRPLSDFKVDDIVA